ncbi:MAG: SRPBCC family protein [Stenotrophobium sp.]
MKTIVVKRTIDAPADKIFALLADHANYKSFHGVKDSKLVKNGKPSKNGVGAIREITAGPAWFREEITAYQQPTRLDYLILQSRPPLEHQGGSIRLEKSAGGTDVTWTTTFRVKIPLIGALITPIMAGKLEKAFGGMLKEIDGRLQKR